MRHGGAVEVSDLNSQYYRNPMRLNESLMIGDHVGMLCVCIECSMSEKSTNE